VQVAGRLFVKLSFFQRIKFYGKEKEEEEIVFSPRPLSPWKIILDVLGGRGLFLKMNPVRNLGHKIFQRKILC